MLQDFLVTLVIAFVVFELIDHVLVPAFWFLLKRNKKSYYGTGGMKNKIVKIIFWEEKSGIVLFHAERWKATSEKPMQPGQKAIVEDVFGLTLKIKPYPRIQENKLTMMKNN